MNLTKQHYCLLPSKGIDHECYFHKTHLQNIGFSILISLIEHIYLCPILETLDTPQQFVFVYTDAHYLYIFLAIH